MVISLTETQWNTVWTLVKSCIDSTDDPKSAAHYERILKRLENPQESAHIKELVDYLNDAQKRIAKLETENAEKKSALLAAIPYIERLKAYCNDGDTICFDNTSDEQDAEMMKALLDQIKNYVGA